MLKQFIQKRVEKDKEYINKSPKFVFNGMRKDDSPIKIGDDVLYNSVNSFKKNGKWKKRPGLELFGSGLPFNDPVVQIEQFFKYDGTEYLVAFTTRNAYLYSSAIDTWVKMNVSDCFTASYNDRFSCETMYDNDTGEVKFIVTNGVDNIKYWNGSGEWQDLPGTPSKCKLLKVFYVWLLLLNCTVSGNEIPQRIDWCVPGNPKDWSGPGSGTNTLAASTGPIVGCEIIRGQVAILLERSITMMYATGTTPPFVFDETKILDVGCMSGGSIQSLGETLLFLGWDDFYTFDGFATTSIGNDIILFFFDDVNSEYVDSMFSHMLEQFGLYLLFYTSASSSSPDKILVYDYINSKFVSIWNFDGKNITGDGYYHAKSGLTIGELTMTIGQMNWRIGTSYFTSVAPFDLFGDSSGNIYNVLESCLNDDGVAIDSYFDTKSFISKIGKYSRYVRQQLYAIGTKIESLISIDNGVNFSSLLTTDLNTNENKPTLTDPFDVTNEKAMFRFRNNELNGWFEFDGFQYYYIDKEDII
jgi:hypothetical protein